MDIHYDEAWCPVCDRQIMPKRYTVSVPPAAPEPLPCNQSRTKTGAVRPRGGGLLQGTGHVKPNGVLKRTESDGPKPRTSCQQQPPQAAKPGCPPKVRTIIDQGPIPLYCSDECRMADLSRLDGAYPIDYNPDRASPLLPPVPHNSFVGSAMCESEDESTTGSGSSLESHSASSESGPLSSPSMAALAAIYGFSLPPAPPFTSNPPKSSSSLRHCHDYQTGVMMAAKRIQAALCPDPGKRFSSNKEPHRPIPGWTDGSDAWREKVYCFSPCPPPIAKASGDSRPSFTASSHRGVQWTSSNTASSSLPACSSGDHTWPCSSQSYTDELYEKFNLGLSRCSRPATPCSTQSLPPLSPTSKSSRRRENPLVKVEGRLLVPNGALRTHSSQSMSSASLCSPRSRYASELSEDSIDGRSNPDLAPSTSRPPQGRSWSYGNVKTYPILTLPPKKEKRIKTLTVDGEPMEVEVEVEVVPPMKRLFLFTGKEVGCQPRR